MRFGIARICNATIETKARFCVSKPLWRGTGTPRPAEFLPGAVDDRMHRAQYGEGLVPAAQGAQTFDINAWPASLPLVGKFRLGCPGSSHPEQRVLLPPVVAPPPRSAGCRSDQAREGAVIVAVRVDGQHRTSGRRPGNRRRGSMTVAATAGCALPAFRKRQSAAHRPHST